MSHDEKAIAGRRFEGEEEGAWLASWLNRSSATARSTQQLYRRILRLLASYRELKEFARRAQAETEHVWPLLVPHLMKEREHFPQTIFCQDFSEAPWHVALGVATLPEYMRLISHTRNHRNCPRCDFSLLARLRKRLDALTAVVDKQLRRYKAQARVSWADEQPSIILDQWWPKERLEERIGFIAFHRLDSMGRLENLRQCPSCSKWIFARFNHQRFCSQACQIKQFRSSPKWKARAARKARARYKKKKEGKART